MAKYLQPNFIVDSSASFLKNTTFNGLTAFDSSIRFGGVTYSSFGTMAVESSANYYTKTETNNLVISGTRVWNGLTKSVDGSIGLGGSLLQDTVIDGSSFILNLGSSWSNSIAGLNVNTNGSGINLNERDGGGIHVNSYGSGGIWLFDHGGGGIYIDDVDGGGLYINDKAAGGTFFRDKQGGGVSFKSGTASGEAAGGFVIEQGSNVHKILGGGITFTNYDGSNGYSLIDLSEKTVSIFETYSGSLDFSQGKMTITDNSSNHQGLQYAADYSSTFVNRSLVDKAYVDSHIGDTSNHDNLSGLSNAASEGAVNGHLTNEQYYDLDNRQLFGENIEGIKTFNSNIVLNERGGVHFVTVVCTSIVPNEGFGMFMLNDTSINYDLIKFIQQTQGRENWAFSFEKYENNFMYNTFNAEATSILFDCTYNYVNYKLAIFGLVHSVESGVYSSIIGGILYETDGVTQVDVSLLPVDVPLTFSYNFPFIRTTVTNVPRPINDTDAANKEYVDDNSQPAIECTYSELKALQRSNNLLFGRFYRIAYGLDDASPAAGQYILMQALSTNEMAVHGSRMMLCPRQYYPGTDSDGNVWLGVWNSSLTPAIGELVVWGAKVFENLTGNVGTSLHFLHLDETNWLPIYAHGATNNQYIPLFFEITLRPWEWSSEYPPQVGLQRDGKNNIVRYSSQVIDDFYGIPFSDWNGNIGENNEALIIVNNTTSVLRNNKVTGELAGNTCGVSNNNIFGSIYNNTCTGYIARNTNKGDISNNSNSGDIFGNNNTGDIANNSILGDINYNRNNGHIHYNTSSIEVNIERNMNNGDIRGAGRTTDVFDTPVNK